MNNITIQIPLPEDFYERLADELSKRINKTSITPVYRLNNKWLTHAEAAAYLKKTPAALYKLTSNRKIKFHKRGKPNYYRIDDLDAYMIAGEMKTADEIKAESHLTLKENIINY